MKKMIFIIPPTDFSHHQKKEIAVNLRLIRSFKIQAKYFFIKKNQK